MFYIHLIIIIFYLFIYLFIFTGSISARSIVLMVLLIVTGLLLFGLLVLGWFSYLLPKIRIKMGQVSIIITTMYLLLCGVH